MRVAEFDAHFADVDAPFVILDKLFVELHAGFARLKRTNCFDLGSNIFNDFISLRSKELLCKKGQVGEEVDVRLGLRAAIYVNLG